MKKIIIPALLATAFLTLPVSQTINAQAIESNSKDLDSQEVGKQEVVKAFLDTENGLEEISIAEYNNYVNNADTSPPIAPTFHAPEKGSISPSNDTGFSIITSRKFLNVTNQVERLHTYSKADMSDWIKGTGTTTTVTQMIVWSNSYTWAATATIGGNWTSAIAPVLGAGWQNNKTYSYNTSFTVKPGYKAKLQFTPIYKEATGDLVAYNRLNSVLSRINNVTIKAPATLAAGKVKGVVTVVEVKI